MNQSIVNAAAGDLQMASAMASARPFRIYFFFFSCSWNNCWCEILSANHHSSIFFPLFFFAARCRWPQLLRWWTLSAHPIQRDHTITINSHFAYFFFFISLSNLINWRTWSRWSILMELPTGRWRMSIGPKESGIQERTGTRMLLMNSSRT